METVLAVLLLFGGFALGSSTGEHTQIVAAFQRSTRKIVRDISTRILYKTMGKSILNTKGREVAELKLWRFAHGWNDSSCELAKGIR